MMTADYTFLAKRKEEEFVPGIRMPHRFDLRIPGSQERFRTGGFFVPVKNLDEVRSTWQFSWEKLTLTELTQLQTESLKGQVTIQSPLKFPVIGYISGVEAQGIPGEVDTDTEEELYSVSMDFEVLEMAFTPYMKPFSYEAVTAPIGTELGVPVDGVSFAVIDGPSGNELSFERKYALMQGGNVEVWAGVNPPEGDIWDRSTRVLTSSLSSAADSTAGIRLDPRHVSPARGSVFLVFRNGDPSLGTPS